MASRKTWGPANPAPFLKFRRLSAYLYRIGTAVFSLSLRPRFRNGAGFTLIELLVVIGLLSVIGSFTVFLGLDAYRGNSFHGERDLLLTALYRARAESINNICVGPASGTGACTDGVAHGVHITDEQFIIFQGNSYNATDPYNEVIQRQSFNVDITPPTHDPVFAQLSAQVAQPGDIIFSDDGTRTSTITVGSEGQITWTN
jgi:prepilin-type N-terminal cleavage/methylation domain-containing protein